MLVVFAQLTEHRQEQERLQDEIKSLAGNRFIEAQAFCDEQSISASALQVLIKRIPTSKEDGLEVLSFDVDPNDRSSGTSGSYVSSSRLRKVVETKIVDNAGKASQTRR